MSVQGYKNVARAAVHPADKAYYDEQKVSKHPIVINMPVKFRGVDRPICMTCSHSITSHAELNGRMVCFACIGKRSMCPVDTLIGEVRRIIQDVLKEEKAQGHCAK